MRFMKAFALLGLTCLGLACVGCGSSNNGGEAKRLTGGGSTFIAPLFDEKWIGEYNQKGVQIDYTGKGSGAGITDMIDDIADFGCTDAAMSADEIKRVGGEDAVVHIPLVMGAVVPVYNLEGVKDLNFTAEILSGVYRNKITNWSDPKIKAANPHAKLPDEKINVAYRADASGTSFIFTTYLTAADKDWAAGPGATKQVKVDGGQGLPGNGPLAEAVKSTKGAIGYVELLYALQNPGLNIGKVKSHDGEFLTGILEGVTAAADNALKTFSKEERDTLRYSIVNAPGKGAYPISGTTWAVVKVKHPADKAKALQGFLKWATHEGQASIAELHYAAIPASIVELADKKIDLISAK
jgi:phosphate ABC transporter phosphate-binding protein